MTITISPPPTRVPATPYRRPRALVSGTLRLDGNEGSRPGSDLCAAAGALDPEALRVYPDLGGLTEALARRHAVAPERVAVTAGADDAMDRVFRAYVEPGREAVVPIPTFEMIHRFAASSGAELKTVPWLEESFPLAAIERRIGPRTALIAVVSPNNPTGRVIGRRELERLAAAADGSILLFDHVYAEYADEDLTAAALALPNVVVLRTLSKAWGLAGCRVGYALARPEIAAVLRSAGNPYPVATPSATIARRRLATGEREMRAHVARVRDERRELAAWLARRGVSSPPSQGNFLLADFGRRAPFVERALAALGVLVRSFPRRAEIAGALRISLPGDPAGFERLRTALATVLEPEAMLFDLDGVLADVGDSYRLAILDTAASFGVELTAADVRRAKLAGNANSDWSLTRDLLAARGVEASLEEVTRRFQSSYLGATANDPGRRQAERPLVSRRWLERLGAGRPLGVVTGRPRAEAEWFLDRFSLADLFSVVVAREDAALKPDPAPVRVALSRLGVERAWLVGDTPDDVAAATAAGVVPIAVPAPGDAGTTTVAALERAGAARVLERTSALEELL